MLVMKLLLLSSICHKLLHHIPVHKRLSSKEVYLQVSSAAGIGNQKIKCLLSGLIAHKSPPAVILALLCKTISAGKIAVVRNVEAKCLYNCLALLEIYDTLFVCIFCEELFIILKLIYFLYCFFYLRLWISVHKLFNNLLS